MTAALHVTNARIWTGWPQHPRAEAVTIVDGRVASLDEKPPGGIETLDAGGRFVAPGLIDAHVHLLTGGEFLSQLDLSGITSREAFQRAIARRHAELPPGAWLIAGGWSQENWPSREMPDKSWLAAAGDRPVVCHRTDLHVALVNDAVLKRCDLSADPPGGRIERDAATGEPTGLLIEAAAWQLINPLIPSPGAADKRAILRAAQGHLHRLGLTTVGSMEYATQLQEVYEPVRDELTLRCRITLLDRGWPMAFDYGLAFENDQRLAVIGYKTFIDGTFGSRTARMLEDYADDPGNRGMLVELAAEGHLLDWARAVAAAGFSPSMHAIGEEAIELALQAAEAAGPACRPRIEHAQQLHVDDMARFAGVIASMQPLHKADDGRYARRRVGEARLEGTFAFRSLHQAGARLAFGSDWPVVSADPLAAIRTAVTGILSDGAIFLPQQNLTAEQALGAYTRGSAYALGLDDAGVLRPGALGDLVIFDGDLLEADWASQPPTVAATIVAGKVVYDARTGAGPAA